MLEEKPKEDTPKKGSKSILPPQKKSESPRCKGPDRGDSLSISPISSSPSSEL